MSETVFEHIRGNDTFTVTAAEPWSVGMLRRLQAKHPDEVKVVCTNQDGSLLAHLPFEWMRIVPKRVTNLTDEQKQARAEQLRKARAGIRENESNSEV